MTAFLKLCAFVLLASAAAKCVDHDPVVAAVAKKMKLPQFDTCASVKKFCKGQLPVPELDLKSLKKDIDYDHKIVDKLTSEVEKLQDSGDVKFADLLALTCKKSCDICASKGQRRVGSAISACGCTCSCQGFFLKCIVVKSMIKSMIHSFSSFAQYKGKPCSQGMSKINAKARQHGIQLTGCSGTMQG